MPQYLQYDITYNTPLFTILQYLFYYITYNTTVLSLLHYLNTTVLTILHYLRYYITCNTTVVTLLQYLQYSNYIPYNTNISLFPPNYLQPTIISLIFWN